MTSPLGSCVQRSHRLALTCACVRRLAPDRLAPYRSAPDRLAPYRLALRRLAPDRSAPDRSAPDRLAPDRSALRASRTARSPLSTSTTKNSARRNLFAEDPSRSTFLYATSRSSRADLPPDAMPAQLRAAHIPSPGADGHSP